MIASASTGYLFEVFVLTFFSVYITYCLFLYINRIINKEYVAFGVLAVIYFLYFGLESSLFDTYFGKSALSSGIAEMLFSMFPAAVLWFLSCAYNRKFRVAERLAICSWMVFAAAAFLVHWRWTAFRGIFDICWTVLAIYTSILALVMSVEAHRQGFYESVPAVVGISGLVIGILLAGADNLGLISIPPHIPDIAVLFFSMNMKYGLIKRYAKYTNDIRHLSGSILTAQEEERKRISREIHDTVAQSLFAIKLNLQLTASRADQGGYRGVFQNMISEISKSIEDLRQIIAGLRPSFSEDYGIVEAMRAYADEYQKRFGIRVIIDSSKDIDRSVGNLKVKDNIYRIYQESLSNVLKHSEADTVTVSLHRLDNDIILEIADNGIGIDQRGVKNSPGIGITTMRERAEMLNGTFVMEGRRGRGTRVRVSVPV